MFDNFSSIIVTITKKHRILALFLLLLTIIIITLGPKLIEMINHDDNALNQRIDLQKESIKKLNVEIIKLNEEILQSQLSCTDRIVEREKEILDKILVMEKIVSTSNRLKNVERVSMMRVRRDDDSTIVKSYIEPEVDNNEENVDLLKQIRNLKKDLSKDIKNNQNQ